MEEKARKLGPITNMLVRLFVRIDEKDDQEIARKSAFGVLEGWVSIVINTILFGLKLALGLMTGSIALIADAAHTFADSLTSVVVIISSKISRRPPDAEHPYGHGRVESIATITCAVLLAIAGFEFAKASIERILEPVPLDASWTIIGIVAATIIAKEWLARFARALGQASGNTTLEAEFWHHRSDVYATAIVVVGMISGKYGIAILDGIMGALVSLMLFKVAFDIAKSSVDALLGKAPSEEEIQSLREKASSVEGVRNVHDIVVHHYGSARFVSLHVETGDSISANELHQLAEAVERKLDRGQHGSVCVHVDPINRDHPDYQPVFQAVREIIENDQCAVSFHDLRIVGEEKDYTVIFDITVNPECSHDEKETIERISSEVKGRSSASEVVIEIEPRYAY